MKTKTFKAAFPYTIPVLTGYLFLGIAFGVLLSSKGYNVFWALLMSIIIFAGSMQFVAIDILTSPFNIIGTIILTLTINARHLFYGLSMLEKYKDMGKKKPYMIFSLTDETYSLLCGINPPENVDKNQFYLFIALLNQLYWIMGSVIGAVAGSLFKFNTVGIDFVMTALFVVIFVEQWEKTKNHIPAVAGIALTLISLLVFGTQNFIVGSMIAILIFLTLLRQQIGGKSDDNYTRAD